jgi:hypothetical protein
MPRFREFPYADPEENQTRHLEKAYRKADPPLNVQDPAGCEAKPG